MTIALLLPDFCFVCVLCLQFQCDCCNEWFHPACANIDPKKTSDVYVCGFCESLTEIEREELRMDEIHAGGLEQLGGHDDDMAIEMYDLQSGRKGSHRHTAKHSKKRKRSDSDGGDSACDGGASLTSPGSEFAIQLSSLEQSGMTPRDLKKYRAMLIREHEQGQRKNGSEHDDLEHDGINGQELWKSKQPPAAPATAAPAQASTNGQPSGGSAGAGGSADTDSAVAVAVKSSVAGAVAAVPPGAVVLTPKAKRGTTCAGVDGNSWKCNRCKDDDAGSRMERRMAR
jgi:hypothetical protein